MNIYQELCDFAPCRVLFHDEIILLSKILLFFHIFLFYPMKMSYTLYGLGHMIDFSTMPMGLYL